MTDETPRLKYRNHTPLPPEVPQRVVTAEPGTPEEATILLTRYKRAARYHDEVEMAKIDRIGLGNEHYRRLAEPVRREITVRQAEISQIFAESQKDALYLEVPYTYMQQGARDFLRAYFASARSLYGVRRHGNGPPMERLYRDNRRRALWRFLKTFRCWWRGHQVFVVQEPMVVRAKCARCQIEFAHVRNGRDSALETIRKVQL